MISYRKRHGMNPTSTEMQLRQELQAATGAAVSVVTEEIAYLRSRRPMRGITPLIPRHKQDGHVNEFTGNLSGALYFSH